MKTFNGELSTRPLSSVIKYRPSSIWRTTLWLATLGLTGVMMHAVLRVPLHLPGHHGLEWMALLAIASVSVPYRGAAFATGISAAAFAALPLWGWHDPFTPLVFAVSALLFDTLYGLIPQCRFQQIMLMLGGGLAFSVAGFISYLTGPHGVAIHSLWSVWVFSHFAFGLLGTLAGLQLATWARSRSRTT